MAYIETLKCRGLYKSYISGTALDYRNQYDQIFGLNLEKSADALSGLSTAGKQIDVDLNFYMNDACTLFSFIRIDALLNINPDGMVNVVI